MGSLGFDDFKDGRKRFCNTGRTWFRKGRETWNKGRKMTPEEKAEWSKKNDAYIEKKHRENPNPWYSKEWIEDQYIKQEKSFAYLGRALGRGECVHHVNLDGKDNRPENLVICDNSYHKWLHWRMEKLYVEEHFGDI